MTAIEELRAEIERIAVAHHARVVIDALQALEHEGLPQTCSYHGLFEVYRGYRIKITHLLRAARLCETDLGYDTDDLAIIDKRLIAYHDKVMAIRPLRYTNVCGTCTACRTRRKRWPIASLQTKPRVGR